MSVWDKYQQKRNRFNATPVFIKDLIGEALEYIDHNFYMDKKYGKEACAVTVIHHTDENQLPVVFFAKSLAIMDLFRAIDDSGLEKGEKLFFTLTYDEAAEQGQSKWGIEPLEGFVPSDIEPDNSDIPF